MHSVSQTLVVIPTAGRVPAELVPFTQSRHSAMVRLQRKPVIYWTMEYLLREGFCHFAFAVERPNNIVQSFVEHLAGWRSQLYFARPEADRGVAYSILCAIEKALRSGQVFQNILIVLGDTYFQFPAASDFSRSFVLTSPFDSTRDEARDWCLLKSDPVSGEILEYRNKLPHVQEDKLKIVAGVYFFTQPQVLHQALQHVDQAQAGPHSGELHQVLERYAESDRLFAVPCQEWYDCGHLANLMRSEEKMVKERAFNAIHLDKVRGVVTKSSSHTSKLGDEIAYYQALPSQLSCLFPRVLEVSPRRDSMDLEFYGYPSLSDSFVFDSLHPRIWEQVFVKLRAILGLFQEVQVPEKSTVARHFRAIYLDKTRERLELLRTQDAFWSQLLDLPDIQLNGIKLRNLDGMLAGIEELCPSLARPQDYSVIHGDLCFSNILYDIPTGTCRLIDPRGSFGEPGIYGDIKYDVAKLSHSVRGSYDFIINDLFHVEYQEGDLQCRVYNHNAEVRHIFEEIFLGEGGFSKREIQLIEGLLFVSMVPLHTESRQRQLAMFATGLERLNSVLEEAAV